MAWTNVGFDGTINEAQWSQMAGLLGNGYVAAGNGDCVVRAVPGARSVSVAAGSLYGDGVVSTNSGAETVAMTTPVNGQWYVIALRRTWATNTAALVAIAGATTTTTTPTAPPTSFPTLNTNVGVLTDQPIAWAWCNSANTTVVVYDIRLKAVKSLPPVVANQNERDAKFMAPTQGLQVWRDDLGAVETYFGLYNASTNPGGRDTAGWYLEDRAGGLIPVRPSSVVIATGSGSANSLGVVSFSGATAISLNNVFTDKFTNYRVILNITNVSVGGAIRFRYRASGTDASTSNYFMGGIYGRHGGSYGPYNADADSSGYVVELAATGLTYGHSAIDVMSPQKAIRSTATFNALGVLAAQVTSISAGFLFDIATQFDGFTLIPTAGTVSGSIQVFGYND